MSKIWRLVILFSILFWGLIACRPLLGPREIAREVTAVPIPSKTPKSTTTPRPSAAPEATPTPLPSLTPEPMVTPTAALTFPGYDCPIDAAAPTPLAASGMLTVVFVGPDGIYRWQEAASHSERIFPASDVTALKMSDDGQLIAFTRHNNDETTAGFALWVMDSAGGNGRQLLSAADLNNRHATEEDLYVIPRRLDWVPGRHTLAYTTIGHRGELSVHFYDDLNLVDANSGTVTTLLPPGAGGDFFYAPDGEQIAIVNDTSLSLVNSDGGNLRPDLLTWDRLGITHEYHRPRPAWLPDSSALLIATSNATDSIDAFYNPDASAAIWRVPANDTPPQQITTLVGAPLGPWFSPDGSQVGFDRVIDDKLMQELRVAAVDNAWNVVYAVGQGLHWRGWPPDSSGFIFGVNREAPQLGRLCRPPVPLPLPETTGSFVRRITWIDGPRFLFTIDEPPQLLLGDLNGAVEPIGTLRPEYFFGVGALSAFDFLIVE